jgi:hypothetical protein
MRSFASPVVIVKPGVVLVAVLIPVIPIHATPEYSATFSSYSVGAEKVGVIVVFAGQSGQTRSDEALEALGCWA